MKISFVVLALSLSAIIIASSFSAQETYGPFSTWDADMINVDTVQAAGLTGEGVYVAVLDTGLAPNWRDYFPEDRVAIQLAKGFKEEVTWNPKINDYVYAGVVHEISYIGSTLSTHGTHVTSTILGYNYYAIQDAQAGTPLPPIFVQGIAPDVTIIPIKVLSEYHFGARIPPTEEKWAEFGTDLAIAAGIRYVTELKLAGYSPMIITMSLGGPEPMPVLEEAIDYAIANGVIVVASAGNEGTAGMGWPGAYEQVISVCASGWKYEWYWGDYVAPPPRNRIWWLQSPYYAYNDVAEDDAGEVYITEFSSRELTGQDLDVVAPGSWVRGPYPGSPGYSHLPWWARGYPALFYSVNPGNFFFVGGTSMSCPHVTGVIATMLQKNPYLTQTQVENILETTALPIPAGSMTVWDLSPVQGFYTYSWGDDATGSGLVQADAAIAATP